MQWARPLQIVMLAFLDPFRGIRLALLNRGAGLGIIWLQFAPSSLLPRRGDAGRRLVASPNKLAPARLLPVELTPIKTLPAAGT